MKNLKGISGLFYLSLITLAFAFASCGDDDDDDKGGSALKFSQDKVEVAIAKTATVTVSGGTEPYTVASSDVKIATVKAEKSTITITGVKEGSATISVVDNNKNVGKFTVTVKTTTDGLDFDKKEVTIDAGKEDIVTIKGGTAPYTAESKDTGIATAAVNGDKITIKGVKAGTTTIAVAGKDKKNSGTVSVTIK